MTKTIRACVRWPSILSIVMAAVSLVACTPLANPNAPQTTVFPASDYGEMIQSLYELIFVLATIVFFGVEGFLVFSLIAFRRKKGDGLPPQIHGNTPLEIAWTVLPSIVLLIITIPTIGTIFASDAIPPTATQHIKVVGHQWWWEFQYPDLGIVTANELHLPIGQTASFELGSVDVLHSFWFPKMGGKMDVFPDRKNHLWFTPNQTGEFYGQCVEFCGTQHANMRMRLHVDSPEAFQSWVQRQKEKAAEPVSDQQKRGAELVQKGACIACHTIEGTPAQGKVGPNLTHVGSRNTIAAGVLDATAQNFSKWITDPSSVKVDAKMPSFASYPDADLAAIVAYLQNLK